MKLKKLQYFKVQADVIEKECEGIQFVFTYGAQSKDQAVGTLFAENGDGLALRMKTLNGDIFKITTGVDIYPELGLITYADFFDINRK